MGAVNFLGCVFSSGGYILCPVPVLYWIFVGCTVLVASGILNGEKQKQLLC